MDPTSLKPSTLLFITSLCPFRQFSITLIHLPQFEFVSELDFTRFALHSSINGWMYLETII